MWNRAETGSKMSTRNERPFLVMAAERPSAANPILAPVTIVQWSGVPGCAG
jgi:hypothetical protein